MKRLKSFCPSDFTLYLHMLLVVVFTCISMIFKHLSHHLGVLNEMGISIKPPPKVLWHIGTNGQANHVLMH